MHIVLHRVFTRRWFDFGSLFVVYTLLVSELKNRKFSGGIHKCTTQIEQLIIYTSESDRQARLHNLPCTHPFGSISITNSPYNYNNSTQGMQNKPLASWKYVHIPRFCILSHSWSYSNIIQDYPLDDIHILYCRWCITNSFLLL